MNIGAAIGIAPAGYRLVPNPCRTRQTQEPPGASPSLAAIESALEEVEEALGNALAEVRRVEEGK